MSLAPDGMASSRGWSTARIGAGSPELTSAARAARPTAVSAARCTS